MTSTRPLRAIPYLPDPDLWATVPDVRRGAPEGLSGPRHASALCSGLPPSQRQERAARAWEIIREAQRLIPEALAHAHCVPSVDLDLMDGLHLDYDSMKRIGERMAFLAIPYVKKGVRAQRDQARVGRLWQDVEADNRRQVPRSYREAPRREGRRAFA